MPSPPITMSQAFISTLPISNIRSFLTKPFLSSYLQTNRHLSSARPKPAQFVCSTALTSSPTPTKQSLNPSANSVIQLALPEWRIISLGMLASLITASVFLVTPLAFGRVIEVVSSYAAAKPTESLSALTKAARRLLLVYLFGAVCRLSEVALMHFAAERVVYTLRKRVFSAMVRSDVATLDATTTGDLLSRLSNDVSVMQTIMTEEVVKLLQGGLEAAVCCTMLFVICPSLAAAGFVVVPLSVLAGLYYGNRTATFSESATTAFARASHVAEEQLSGIRIVKSFARESYAEALYTDSIREVLRLECTAGFADAVLQAWNRGIFTVNTTGILLFGGRLVASGSLRIGAMMAFILYASNLMGALGKLSSGMGEIVRASGAVERIITILETEPSIERRGLGSEKSVDNDNGVDYTAKQGALEFRNVSFKYPGNDRKILKNLSFKVPAGGSVAFVGESGAGKSTTLSLLCRLYDPSSGEVLLDGKPLQDFELLSLRENVVGIVSQEPFLISGTIADNIAFGRSDASRDDVVEAATAAGVTQFSDRLRNGLDTVVTRLSGGEQQRVMIARCLAKRPKVMVLDEPTSALDRRSAALVNDSIASLIQDKERTVIIISHKLTSVQQCDSILVFDQGEVVEQGTHEELLARNGAYCKLLRGVK